MTTTPTRTYELTHAEALDLADALRFRADALDRLADGLADTVWREQAAELRRLADRLMAPWA